MAEKLGRTVEELLTSITSMELTQWRALWRIRAQEAEEARRKR